MPKRTRPPDEVVERMVQVLGDRVHAALPDGVHFLLIAYHAKGGEAFITWSGSGTEKDRHNVIAELYTAQTG